MDNQALYTEFMKLYSPSRVKDYTVPARKPEEIPAFDGQDAEQLRNIAMHVDEQRLRDPNIGMQMAGQDLLENLIRWLSQDGRVHAESLMAVIGAMGGHELQRAIMQTLGRFEDKQIWEVLGILIAETKTGEKNLFGDFAGNEFSGFYMTAAQSSESPVEKLKPISSACASAAGTEKYWETPFNKQIGISPKGIVDIFDHKFDKMFATFTRFPHERPMAYAFAAMAAIKKVENVLKKEDALTILAEYGWRTSHYIC